MTTLTFTNSPNPRGRRKEQAVDLFIRFPVSMMSIVEWYRDHDPRFENAKSKVIRYFMLKGMEAEGNLHTQPTPEVADEP